MVLIGGNWSTERETCSVGVRWMYACGSMMDWFWQSVTEVLLEIHYIAWVVGEWIVVDNGVMVLTGGFWSVERETLCSVCGRWMNGSWNNGLMVLTGGNRNTEKEIHSVRCSWINGIGSMVECYWQVHRNTGRETCNVGGRLINVCGAMVEWFWRGNWSTGRETCSVCVRLMNGCGAMVDRSWQGKLKYWERNIM